MHVSKKRRASIAVTLVVVVLAGVASLIGAAAGDTERISAMWISARLKPTGLEVTEVIDYDFGTASKHGIFRDIPDLAPNSRVEVVSSTAPDLFEVLPRLTGTRIKIGDPLTTISGRHRYRIDFVLNRDAVISGSTFDWAAVGTSWDVGLSNIDIYVDLGGTSGSFKCVHGEAWSENPCQVEIGSNGIASTHIDKLSAGEGVRIGGIASGSTSDRLPPPTGPAHDPGTGILQPALIAVLAALAASLPAVWMVRRAGREQVWAGGAAVAAFGPDDPNAPIERIDERRLGELATTEFEAPRGMSAVEGAVLLAESVKDHHQAAWLLESATRGEIIIEGDMQAATLVRTGQPAHPAAEPVLRRMFGSRQSLNLTKYDSGFASGWQQMKQDIERWQHGADYWDRTGHRRRDVVRVLGLVGMILGLGIAALGAVEANRSGGSWLTVVAIGAGLAGLAGASMIHSWELLIRSPDGSARWLQVESFRRFLHDSEARHVQEAAERGLLREYTAWAVALDEADRWTLAVAAANRADPTMQSRMGNDLAFIALGSSLSHSTHTASTQPSSSGGGGGGFSVGGGGGGGGGGSW